MKALVKFCLAMLCLPTICVPPLVSIAHADKSAAQKWAKDCVQHRLVAPLTQQESKRSPFSRAAPPPDERRVSVLSTEFSKDDKGREFLPFEVDARHGEDWHTAVTGCVVRGTGDVFVQVGDDYRSSDFLLGKEAEPVRGVCRAKAAEPGA